MSETSEATTPTSNTTPSYYRIPEGAKDLFDIIVAFGMTYGHTLAIEYLFRAGRKPGVAKVDDLRKAVANLEYEIARLEEK